ncbi:MAG: radical SAM protein [bacterium]
MNLPQSHNETYLLRRVSSPGPAAVMVYPNSYRVGMSSLGFHQVFRHLDAAGLSVQRGFYDETDTDPRSFEMRDPIFRFPLVAYSLTYEPDIFNTVCHLNRAGIPPLWRDRDDRSPIVLIGGLAVASNPAIAEEFADVICIGEGEAVIPAIAGAVSSSGRGRREILESLSGTRGLYIPPLGFAENRYELQYRIIEDLGDYPCHTVILTPDDEFGGAFLVEASRGCSHRCKFCLVSHRVGPARFRSASEICDLVDEYGGKIYKVGLMGAAVSDHPELTTIAGHLVQKGLSFSTSSLRADRLSDEFLALLRKGGNKTITLAPEAGDDSQRRRLGKGIRSSVILEAAQRSAMAGFSNLKLYWLIGTPGEDIRAECDAIIKFSRELEQVFLGHGGRRVTCTVSPCIPKPLTPFAEEPMAPVPEIRRAMRNIRRALAFRGTIRVPPQSAWEAYIEALLSTKDREFLTPRIIQVALGEESARTVFCE